MDEQREQQGEGQRPAAEATGELSEDDLGQAAGGPKLDVMPGESDG